MGRDSLTHLKTNGDFHLLIYHDKTTILNLESFSCHRAIIGWGLLSYLDGKSIRTRLPRKESFYKL